jgi:hypothetical protein
VHAEVDARERDQAAEQDGRCERPPVEHADRDGRGERRRRVARGEGRAVGGDERVGVRARPADEQLHDRRQLARDDVRDRDVDAGDGKAAAGDDVGDARDRNEDQAAHPPGGQIAKDRVERAPAEVVHDEGAERVVDGHPSTVEPRARPATPACPDRTVGAVRAYGRGCRPPFD